MPTAPAGRCTQVGCHALATAESRCPTHQRVAPTGWHRTSAAHAGGGTRAARALAKRVLREQPWCARCGAPATEADHIKAIALGGARMDRANMQALCHPCHARKTARDRRLVAAARKASRED